MDEHEGSGVGPRGEDAPGTPSEERRGPVDPLVEGAPVDDWSGVDGDPDPGADTPPPLDEADLGVPLAVTDSPHAWVGAATAAGLALMVVELLVLLGTIAQGLAVDRLEGDLFHKIGVAFLSNVGTANGLTILAAAVLAALPVLVGAPVTTTQQSRRALALALGAILALVVVLATPIAVRARLHVLDVSGQPVDALARRVLGTYTIGTLGTAAVALGACLGLARAGVRRTDGDADSSADDADEAGPAPGQSEDTVAPHP